MSRNVRKPTMWFLTRSDTNQAVQPLEMARDLKFCIKEVKVLYYPSNENKGADQLHGYLFSHMENIGFFTTQFKYLFVIPILLMEI